MNTLLQLAAAGGGGSGMAGGAQSDGGGMVMGGLAISVIFLLAGAVVNVAAPRNAGR